MCDRWCVITGIGNVRRGDTCSVICFSDFCGESDEPVCPSKAVYL